ncbi:MAG: hypothetical protein K2M94_04795 [Paramuribaculum sp.]|nr:hypothetical protein [Paramuribaculum sp.]
MKILASTITFDNASDITTQNIGVQCFADSALVTPGRPFFLPDFSTGWLMKAHLAVRISRLGKNISTRFAHRYYDAASLLLQLMPTDTGAQGISCIFDSALYLYPWLPLPEDDTLLTAQVLGQDVDLSGMYHIIDSTVSHISSFATLKIGDIIMPCSLSGTVDVTIGSELPASLFATELPALHIK